MQCSFASMNSRTLKNLLLEFATMCLSRREMKRNGIERMTQRNGTFDRTNRNQQCYYESDFQ